MRWRLLLAALAGAASVLAFAPFGLFPVVFLSLGVLVHLLQQTSRRRDGWWLGFAWGWGSFITGVSWLYVALNRYGGMPAPIAAFAIALFCVYLAFYPALVGALYLRLRSARWFANALLFAALWLLGEWLRGVVFTGFPWLAVGYTQTPPSPLAGFVPLLGVYGVSALVALLAALLALAPWRQRTVPTLLGIVLLLGSGAMLRLLPWTEAVGKPVAVALVQTDFDQRLKWDPQHFARILEDNLAIVHEQFSGAQPPALLVLPETTLPSLLEHLPAGYLETMAALAARSNGNVIVGAFRRDEAGHIYNAALSLGAAPVQDYAKQHLVPFGEYSPPLFGWFYRLASIPMSDQTPGAPDQPPLALGGEQIAVNICYEDLFGAELVRSLPQASVLLNISNLAWYGRSLAQPQHLQIARVRALESGRPMLRATNTGMTALILPDGKVAAVLPEFVRDVLQVRVHGHQGMTPFARFGNVPALLAALLIVLLRYRSRQISSR